MEDGWVSRPLGEVVFQLAEVCNYGGLGRAWFDSFAPGSYKQAMRCEEGERLWGLEWKFKSQLGRKVASHM
jgi:hypothetical protein